MKTAQKTVRSHVPLRGIQVQRSVDNALRHQAKKWNQRVSLWNDKQKKLFAIGMMLLGTGASLAVTLHGEPNPVTLPSAASSLAFPRVLPRTLIEEKERWGQRLVEKQLRQLLPTDSLSPMDTVPLKPVLSADGETFDSAQDSSAYFSPFTVMP